jgi:hypothetical protein
MREWLGIEDMIRCSRLADRVDELTHSVDLLNGRVTRSGKKSMRYDEIERARSRRQKHGA